MSADFGYDARHTAEMRSVTFRRGVNFEPRPCGVALARTAEKQVLRQALRDVLAQHDIDEPSRRAPSPFYRALRRYEASA